MKSSTVSLNQSCHTFTETQFNLTEISKKSLFIFDLDGTVWLDAKPLPNVPRAIEFLRNEGKQIVYVTNNSSKSRDDYYVRLSKFGLCNDPKEIVLSTDAVISFLKKNHLHHPYILGTRAMREMCREAGIYHHESFAKVDSVVVAFDVSVTASKLTRAARLIMAGVPYVVANPDTFCPSAKGPIVDAGSYYACIKAATGIEPLIVLGKPSLSMIEEVESRFQVERESMVMVGDRLHTDIAFAQAARLSSVLVLSGETSLANVGVGPYRPCWIADSLAEFREKGTLKKYYHHDSNPIATEIQRSSARS